MKKKETNKHNRLHSFFGFLSFQLQCEVKNDLIWDLICKEWMNSTNCKKDENNIIHLKSIAIHDHIVKLNQNGQDCLFFPKITTNYTNNRKHHIDNDLFYHPKII